MLITGDGSYNYNLVIFQVTIVVFFNDNPSILCIKVETHTTFGEF